MATFNAAKGDEPNYQMLIACPGQNIEIIVDMPEQLTLATQSDWEAIMSASLAGAVDSGIGAIDSLWKGLVGVAAKPFNVQHKALTTQIWLGTAPIEIPLQIQFNAKTDATQDVFKPMAALTSLVLPNNGMGGLLLPPGPLLGGFLGGYGVTVRIGRILVFQECIITSCQTTYDTRLDKSGIPISGEAEITIRTSTVIGRTDLLQAMGLDLTN